MNEINNLAITPLAPIAFPATFPLGTQSLGARREFRMSSPVQAPADWVPVERRLLGMDRSTLVPAAVVAALVAVTFWGLPAINAAIEVDDPIRAGDVVQVDSVEFVPVTGWDLVDGVRQGDAESTGQYPPQAVLTSGGLTFEVLVDDFDGTPGELLQQVQKNNERVKDTAFEVAGRPITIENTEGDRGAFAAFTSAGSDGFLATYVFDGVGVEIVAIGPSAVDDDALSDGIVAMLRSVRPATDGSPS